MECFEQKIQRSSQIHSETDRYFDQNIFKQPAFVQQHYMELSIPIGNSTTSEYTKRKFRSHFIQTSTSNFIR